VRLAIALSHRQGWLPIETERPDRDSGGLHLAMVGEDRRPKGVGFVSADDKDAPVTMGPAPGASAALLTGGIWKKLTDRTLDEYPSPGPRAF
jgi:hypothetical protein